MSFCFIVNPAAGGGFVGSRWPALRDKLLAAGIEHDYHLTDYRGHGVELAQRAFESGSRNFVAVGGDGTANEVLNGLLNAYGSESEDLYLGAVPWGTGNDWARYYGLPSTPDDCVQLFRSGSSCQQDIGRITFVDQEGSSRHRYFLNCAGTGFDSFLLDQMKTAMGSRTRYLLYVLKCLLKYRASPLRLNIEGELFEDPVLLLEVCVGRYAGAGMCLAPAASAGDGVFEVLLIEDISVLRLLGSLFYLYNGNIRRHPAAKSWQCRTLSVAAQTAQFLQCDGELAGRLPVRIEIMPRALRVLAPEGAVHIDK